MAKTSHGYSFGIQHLLEAESRVETPRTPLTPLFIKSIVVWEWRISTCSDQHRQPQISRDYIARIRIRLGIRFTTSKSIFSRTPPAKLTDESTTTSLPSVIQSTPRYSQTFTIALSKASPISSQPLYYYLSLGLLLLLARCKYQSISSTHLMNSSLFHQLTFLGTHSQSGASTW